MCIITAALCICMHVVLYMMFLHVAIRCHLSTYNIYKVQLIHIYHAYLYICRVIIMSDVMVHIACLTLSLLVGSYAGEHMSVEIEQLETCLSTQKSIAMARPLVHLSLPVATR